MSTAVVFWSRNLCLSVIMLLWNKPQYEWVRIDKLTNGNIESR